LLVSKVVVLLRITDSLRTLITASAMPPWLVFVAMMVSLFILGCFLDGSAMAVLTIPIFAPVVTALGFNPLWFVVLFVINTEIGLLTPPVGLNLFVVQEVGKMELDELLRGVLPFIAAIFVTLLLVAFFPVIATWLPGLMR